MEWIRKYPPTLWLAGVQWLFFIFTNTIVVPISIGHAFQLPHEEISASIERSFILTGVLCILQACFGHRYAVMDGAAGVWWGLTLSLCTSAQSVGMSLTQVGGGLAAGFLLAGLSMMILGYFGFAGVLQRLFTPTVKGVALFLLTIQLTMNFFKGALGLNAGEPLNLQVAAISIGIAVFVAWLQLKGRGLVGNFSLLIGIAVGWVVYDSLLPGEMPVQMGQGNLLSLFPWGKPNGEIGMILTAFIVGLINMTNTITCLSAVEKLYRTETTAEQYKRSYLLTGCFSVLASLFGILPFGLFTSSVGFLESTRILRRSALIIGAGLMVLLGLIPSMSGFFSTLPSSVGNAVLFIAYLQMFGTALRMIHGVPLNSRTIYRVALPVLFGIGIMNTPPQAFASLPLYISPLVGNGLTMGILLSLALEKMVNWAPLSDPLPSITRQN